MTETPEEIVTVSDAAEMLGVSVSSVKRWVDGGVLPAVKTSGGHRRLRVSDIMSLARSGVTGGLNIDFFRKRRVSPLPLPEPAAVYSELLNLVKERKPEELAIGLDRARQAGLELHIMGDEVIFPLMDEVGKLWQEKKLDVADEHLATRAIHNTLARWKESALQASPKSGRLAVGACPQGDYSGLGNFLVELSLLERGWKVLNLGPNTPMDSLAMVAREQHADLVWLTCTFVESEASSVTDLQALHQKLMSHGTALFLGGRALQGPLRRKLTFDWQGDTLAQLDRALADRFPAPRETENRETSKA